MKFYLLRKGTVRITGGQGARAPKKINKCSEPSQVGSTPVKALLEWWDSSGTFGTSQILI
jgi:hypothetical protein